MAQRRQLGGWPHRSGHKPWFGSCAVSISHLSCQFCCFFIELKGLVLQAVFRQHHRSSTEGVGFDHITASIEELSMHALYGIRPRDYQIFIAAFEVFPTKIICRQLELLQRGARGPIKHQYGALGGMKMVEETGGGCTDRSGCHRRPIRSGHPRQWSQSFRSTRVTQWA